MKQPGTLPGGRAFYIEDVASAKVVRWAPTRDLPAISVPNLIPIYPHNPFPTLGKGNHYTTTTSSASILTFIFQSEVSIQCSLKVFAWWLKALPEATQFRSLLVFFLHADHFTFVKSSGVNWSLEYFLLKYWERFEHSLRCLISSFLLIHLDSPSFLPSFSPPTLLFPAHTPFTLIPLFTSFLGPQGCSFGWAGPSIRPCWRWPLLPSINAV